MSTSGGSSGGSGAVSSVFTRTGAVVATTGDYTRRPGMAPWPLHIVVSGARVAGRRDPRPPIGQLYVDTTNGALYHAGSTTTGDWAGAGGAATDPSVRQVGAVTASQGGPSANVQASDDGLLSPSSPVPSTSLRTPPRRAQLTPTQASLGVPLDTAAIATVSAPSISTGVQVHPQHCR